MNINWHAIGQWIAGAGIFIGSFFGYHGPQNLGATIYKPVPRYESSLALALPAAQTSTMTMVSGVDGNGQPLSGLMCFTLDSGVANKVEDVCGSASGTVVSNLVRGIDTSGYTSSSTLAHDHRVGADVKTTDSPYLLQYYAFLNGTLGLPNALQYATSVTNASITANNQNLVDYALLASTSFSGVSDASTIQKGIVEIATKAEVANGSSSGGTTAPLVIPSGYANSTSTATTTIVVSGPNGKIDPNFIPQDASTSYNFLGGITIASGTIGSTTYGGTQNYSNAFITGLIPFGGTGASGTLSLSGTSTLTLNAAGASVAEWDFTSISLTQSSTLNFSNPSFHGTVIILASQGACTITGASTTINLVAMGASSSQYGVGLVAGPASGVQIALGITNGANPFVGNELGGAGVHMATSSVLTPLNAFAGAGGAEGGGGGRGLGGIGGGGLFLKCGGALTLTSSTINTSGSAGAAGSAQSATVITGGAGGGGNEDGAYSATPASVSTGGGGGGGGAGSIVIAAKSISANTGNFLTTGGVGGTGGVAGNNGGAGVVVVSTSTPYR